MNLSERGKKIWWAILVIGIAGAVCLRLNSIFSGNAAQTDIYLLLILAGLLLAPLFSEIDILGVKLRKDSADGKESPQKHPVLKNHMQNIYNQYVHEPDILKRQRWLFTAIFLLGMILLILNIYQFGAPLVLIAAAYGEFFYKGRANENRVWNKAEIISYLKANDLKTNDKLLALSKQFQTRGREAISLDIKASLLLAALLAPYYLKVIDLLFGDMKSILVKIPSISASMLVLLAVILNASTLLRAILWFTPQKQRVCTEISCFLIEEVLIDI